MKLKMIGRKLTLFYRLLERLAAICFNILNILLAGNLPPFGSICLVVEEQGRYLVIERPSGFFVFPGGFMRWHEYPTQTAQREGREETGLELCIGDVVNIYPNPSVHIFRMSTLTICYTAKVIGGELQKSVEGQPHWLNEVEIRSRMHSFFRKMLDDYLQYRSERAQSEVSEGE